MRRAGMHEVTEEQLVSYCELLVEAWFEVAGAVERLSSITNGSIKHLPLRVRS